MLAIAMPIKAKRSQCIDAVNYRRVSISLFFVFLFVTFMGVNTGMFSNSPVDYFVIMRATENSVYHNLGEVAFSGNRLLSAVLVFFVFPSLVSIQSIACSLRSKNKSDFYLLLATSLVSMYYAYMYQAGFPIATFFNFSVVSAVFFDRGKNLLKKAFFLFLIVVFVLFYLNVRESNSSIVKNLEKYVLDYRTLGISLYSLQIDNAQSVLHIPSYGGSFLGGVGALLYKIEQGVLGTANAFFGASSENSEDNDKFFMVGYSKEGDALYYNAFMTVLFGMYRDFREVGIVVYSFLLGFALGFLFKKSENSLKFKCLFVFLSDVVFSGITVSPIERSYFWFSFIYIILMVRKNKQHFSC